MTNHIDTVLVANRGEIACRVMRTLRAEGVRSVAVHSAADAAARHTREADLAVAIGPAPARESYLVAEKLLDAARRTGAQAIHPGYGFLSENAEFAKACEDAGIIFIGPPASAIETMGDKITARAAVEARGVPTVPGISRPGLTDEEIIAAAPGIGFPVLIKPSAGGGGKGMHRVENPEDLPAALITARREAASSFGDDSLFLEHFVDTPRHIEVQIIADAHGNVVHLGERECSLQRRHQKVIEEAPSPLLDEATRAEIGQAACDAARSVGYVGAGTVEFIVPAARPDHFYFMEMNTRLQVEHPVTEEVSGIDLVATQLAVARGEELPFTQDGIVLRGHSIEARIYAEDPAHDFLPTGGTVTCVVEPTGPGVRVDSGIVDGSEVTSLYDPMLMKVIAHGADRQEALDRLDAALAGTVVAGVGVNTDFCRFLLNVPEVRAGDLDTSLLERVAPDYAPTPVPAEALAAAALILAQPGTGSAEAADAWVADGWRLRHPAERHVRLAEGTSGVPGTDGVGTVVTVDPAESTVTVGDTPAFQRALDIKADREPEQTEETTFTASIANLGAGQWSVNLDGTTSRWALERHADQILLTGPRGTWALTEQPAARSVSAAAEDDHGTLASPMPGTVVALAVAEGDHVEPGDAVVVVEAMKMEHVLRAAEPGTVIFHCAAGETVPAGQPLATVEPDT
ncbi:acetyl/propionyl-CoA carboxylase subuit alpha [Corynebacterium sp. HMSC077D10]|uniref:ATP-binding protein n=1 Tax=unclassified Corynebacterium TaxID=2624378 RepID=UPI0008A4DC14|nr:MULTISPECIES: biotin carboxylase N-terminal domain-containing protein [unclassified Corynebacterium]OFL78014.1 acetyl/propionyl-CoA carboxylase subuit alpha [Corynebacterium sp. HMSC077B05]OFP18698.1 acetyl/propionyl-CoA carboxylase subuit alpha [Corynebacterium sp. HMSC065A05]OFP71225.1 acetyl/propionyl-CoA carboxylase subuit alpha [Corynebacterium sp. HMSC077D10]